MKGKRIIATILAATAIITAPITAKADVLIVPQKEITYEFLQEHTSDTIYMYCYGKRINHNGDGVDTDGWYIKYFKGKVGVKFTSIFRFNNGATEVDDFNERIDLKGWQKPFVY